MPVPDEDDDLSEGPTDAQLEWACDQLSDADVAHVRAKLASVPWLGKPWKRRLGPKSPDESVGTASALSFFGGHLSQV